MQLKSLEDTQKFSKKISKIIKTGDIIFLYGEIGVGKTTFVRYLINNLEIENNMKESQILSPTFNIVFNYKIKKLNIMHYDLFRLKDSREVGELGIFAEIENCITIIEWPELIKEKPKDRIEIFLSYLGQDLEKRNFEISGYGKWNDYDFKKT